MGTLDLGFLVSSKNKNELSEKLVIILLENYEIDEIAHLKLGTVIERLKEKNIVRANNKVNKSSLRYIQYFKESESTSRFDLKRVTKKVVQLFAGKMGTANGKNYILLSSSLEISKALDEFKKKYEDVEENEIFEAIDLYFSLAKKKHGMYEYAPKAVTFISGSTSMLYLYNYVMLNRNKDKEDVVNKESGTIFRYV